MSRGLVRLDCIVGGDKTPFFWCIECVVYQTDAKNGLSARKRSKSTISGQNGPTRPILVAGRPRPRRRASGLVNTGAAMWRLVNGWAACVTPQSRRARHVAALHHVVSGARKLGPNPNSFFFWISAINIPSWAFFEGFLNLFLGPISTESFFIESSSRWHPEDF